MPNLNLDGQNIEIDRETAQRVMNTAERPEIKKILDDFWTEEKLGRHSELKNDHGSILVKNLLVDPETFREDLMANRINLGNMSSCLESILSGTKLKGDLKPSYITDCLGVTTVRPAIGKGEFLFAASFSNLGFSKDTGDLIELGSKAKIEVKGISAQLGDGQNERFKPMRASVIRSIARMLGIDDIADFNLTTENAQKFKRGIGLNENSARRTFLFLQNIRNENEALARNAAKLYFEKKQLMKTVAAVHLFTYMKLEKDQYLLIVNDKKFAMFKAPDDLWEAYSIVEKLDIKPWREGEYGMKVTLR